MKIQKRDGSFQEFNGQKIATAIQKAFQSGDTEISPAILQEIVREITRQAEADASLLRVEKIQDLVEEQLMHHRFYQEAKRYILYRQKQAEHRQIINELLALTHNESLRKIMVKIQKDYQEDVYDLRHLHAKFQSFIMPMHAYRC